MDLTHTIEVVCVVLFTAVAAVWDLRFKKLPNVLTVTALGCAVLFHLGAGAVNGGLRGTGQELLTCLGGFATGFGLLWMLYAIGGGGGGDVKFMAALGAWLGAWATFEVFIVTGLLVLIGSIGVLTWEFLRLGLRGARARYFSRNRPAEPGRKKVSETERRVRRRLMPFGVPAALATWLVLCWQIHQW